VTPVELTLVTNSMICHELGNDSITITTNRTYSWSFVTQIFNNGKQSRGGDGKTLEIMTSTSALGTLVSVVLYTSGADPDSNDNYKIVIFTITEHFFCELFIYIVQATINRPKINNIGIKNYQATAL